MTLIMLIGITPLVSTESGLRAPQFLAVWDVPTYMQTLQ